MTFSAATYESVAGTLVLLADIGLNIFQLFVDTLGDDAFGFSVEFCHTLVSCWFIVLLYYFQHLMFCAFRFHARTIDEYSNCLINAGNSIIVPRILYFYRL